jgi:hypothetical protein
MFQVFGDVPRNQNVTSVAAVHHALRDVDAGTGNVCLLVEISDDIHRPTVNAHANANLPMFLQLAANFERTENRRFRSRSKYKRASVASWQTQKFSFRFCGTDLLRSAHDLFQFLNLLALLVNEQFRVTDDVDEQDVPDLELHI